MSRFVRCMTKRSGRFFTTLTGMMEERKRDGEMEGDKGWRVRRRCTWVVDKACENGRVQKEVERLYRR